MTNLLLIALLGLPQSPVTARGEEPPSPEAWADPSVALPPGCRLWIDPARQAAARAARGNTLPPSGPGLEVIYDGSGHGHDLVQLHQASQPTLVATQGRAVLRFDGSDDALERTGLGGPLERATVFLVLAPRSNAGGFRGLLAMAEHGRRDYDSGFNLDLGPVPSARFDSLNAEGRGFGGAHDLLDTPSDFGGFHLVEVVLGDEVAVSLDGHLQSRRPRDPAPLATDVVTLGARCFSNEARAQFLQCHFDGDLAEILVFDRVLDDAERAALRKTLLARHAGLAEALAQIQPVPPFQFLLPGFQVRRLPVELTNINNIRYRPDGTLVALAYSGDILLLSDRDGDGLEEHVETFWAAEGRLRGPIGMALASRKPGEGLAILVASKGKLSLIADHDGDDRADSERVVASGWEELPVAVDALGVALSPDGSVYFGLGTGDYTNAYRLDEQGRSHYDLAAERGVILRVDPSLSRREIVATGIRFTVGLAFNARGDLFATEQEGATWLPNGNPLDELLHIRAGRHYGFPPRHATHLPDVIDEPSTFDYRPQHQSLCGIAFNGGGDGEAAFGPAAWKGDALVTAYSRGAILRTKLVPVADTYIARSQRIAVMNTLPVDVAVGPSGGLIVATHSGAPDWGSGPTGEGTLYKVEWVDRAQPLPVLAWCAGPDSLRVAFDRPLDPSYVEGILAGTKISAAPSATAGDRLESLRPGYAVVGMQTAEPRRAVAVHSAELLDDLRTIALRTDSLRPRVTYAVTLPAAWETPPRDGAIPQQTTVDLQADTYGVMAGLTDPEGTTVWSGWIPHLDLDLSRALTSGSAEHDRLWRRLGQPGTLTLETDLRLTHLLRPEVQPGSIVDDRLPPEQPLVDIEGPPSIRLETEGAELTSSAASDRPTATATLQPRQQHRTRLPLRITLPSGPSTRLSVRFRTTDDDRPRPLGLERFLMPWAIDIAGPAARSVPAELAGGSVERGRTLFFGDRARCSQCHAHRGQGGATGPDLSNLGERDLTSVRRDIETPSAAINPDYVTQLVALGDGRTLRGTVRTRAETLEIGTAEGQVREVPLADVEAMSPEPTSTMPEGLLKELTVEEVRDLLTFLLMPGGTPP